MPEAPLAGLRVLELATGVAGPYAGRLLAMLGATVVKAEPVGGDPSRRQWIDDTPPPDPSPLFVHLGAGKRLVSLDATDLDDAIEWADVVIDDRVRRDVIGGPLEPAALQRRGARRPVVARITAWGFDADDPGVMADELLVQAASGLMNSTGDTGREPLRFPGWQSQYLAGGFAAAGVLAVSGGDEREVEVSWVGAALTAVEAGLAGYLHAATAPLRPEGDRSQRAIQDGAFPAGAFACADGHVIPGTVRPIDWTLQCGLYDRPDLEHDERFVGGARWQNRETLRAEIQPWYDTRAKRAIFEAALDAGWAAAMVLNPSDLSDDPHLDERRFLSPVKGAVEAVVAGRPWRADGVREGEPVQLEAAGESSDWFRAVAAARSPGGHEPPAAPPMRDVRILELTWAWAGPFVGRLLGTLGADVVRLETGSRPDGWRTRVKWKWIGAPLPGDVDPDAYTWDAAALFNTVNRNKRSASVDLATDGGRHAFRRLLDAADVLVVNMTASVLADRGVEADVLAAVDRGLVAVSLPAVGATGPYRAMAGYGTLTEGMGGFAARFGYEDEGARASTTYYPDDVAGLHATVAVLAGLAARSRDGRGSFIDLSQQEVTWLQVGEGIPHFAMTGRDPGRLGNREPGVTRSGIERDGDGWTAFVGERRAPVVTWASGLRAGLFAQREMVEELEHPVTGLRTYMAMPVRIDGRLLTSVRPAPRFAEHTDEVLREWATMDADEVAELRAAGAVGTTPSQPRRAAP